MTKTRIIRYILLKIETRFHDNYPWILVDLLHDRTQYFKNKQDAYQFAQTHKQFWECVYDITESKDENEEN